MHKIAYWRIGNKVFNSTEELKEFFRMNPQYYYAKGYDYFGNHVYTFRTREPFSRFKEEYSEYRREATDRLFNKD